ncbi:MAG: ParB family chromosome partitioning protein [Gammaproteobacteria bacterium]|jgi:ParB family chromosome partitioning protein
MDFLGNFGVTKKEYLEEVSLMATKKRGLGKGLDALLGLPADTGKPVENSNHELRTLPVDMIQRGPYQPRSDFNNEQLEELASSIKANGIIQPIVVRQISNGKHEIIAGERRWRAAQLAGLHEIPVVIRKVSDAEAMSVALIENIQRQDLNPLEEAMGISRLLKEFDMTHDVIAEALGKSRSTISNLLRLLDLIPSVKQFLEKGDIEMGHARALLALAEEDQLQVAKEVVKNGLSVRETEALVRKLQNKTTAKKKDVTTIDPNIRTLQEDLSSRLAAAVLIKHKKNGNGTLEIHYNSVDELDGILSRIK